MAEKIENRGPLLMAINLTFLSLALVCIVLRCFVRVFMVKAFGKDDWLMLVGTVFFTLYASCSTAGVTYGTGRHHADLETKNIQTAMKFWWFCYLWYALAMISCKASIGFFLLRFTTVRLQRWAIYLAMMSTALSGGIFFFVSMFQCKPVSSFWNKEQDGSCVNVNVIIALATLYSVFAVISDFMFALLPGLIIWKLQLHKRTKLSLIPLLAMGCVASSAVIARFPYLPMFRKPDFLWNTLDIAIWSTVEQGLAIIAGSLATLRPLIKLAAFRLGLTSKPHTARPSDYASGLATPRAGTQLGFSPRDAYTLSSIGRDEAVDAKKGGLNSGSSSEFQAGIKRETKWEIKVSKAGKSESEEELRSPQPWAAKQVSRWDE
ncbi:hypothetical protein B0J13DRAFT_285537 [Dactylonectria estremocensis]|uniref:Rhodopsin domain-containing protein n=1 Tax=Dactylonectria estremocensis TaxID=1079267 RepID=A0A9P9J9C0_9HYPO|nr:hypothetical protein B0J13DRAFT_285537 [Dactylonectria estremocensis]